MNEILLPSIAAFVFAELSGIPQHLKSWLFRKKIWYARIGNVNTMRRLKPLDCSMCLSLWLSLANSVYLLNFDFMQSAENACYSCVIGYLISKIHERIK